MLYQTLIEDNLKCKKIILKNTKDELTYEQLHKKTMRYAACMKKRGIQQADRVLIISDNSIACVAAVLACISLGAVFIILPSTTAEKQMQFIIKDSAPKLVCHPQQNPLRIIFGGNTLSFQTMEEEKSRLVHRIKIDTKSLCYILYTSGSTKEPKGVAACQKQVLFCSRAIQSMLKNTEEDRILCALPLSFDFGLYQIFLGLMFCSEILLLEKFIIPQIPVYLDRYNITVFPAVPSMINLLIKTRELNKYPLPYLRQINSTGDRLEPSVIHSLMKSFPNTRIVPMYGLTECKRVSIMPEGHEDKVLAGSCGKPLPGVSVSLVNQDEKGVGELMVAGENVMEGYWGNPEDDTFQYDPQSGQRILKTGDLFSIDEEGFLYYKGRIKNIIKSNGYRLSNVELEAELQQIAEFIEVKVFGIPDEIIGEKICAAIYTMDTTPEEKILTLCKTLPPYHKPHIVYISRKPLPKNTNGKLDQRKLKEEQEKQINL